MYMIAERVSMPGRPWVMMYGCPKTLAEARMVVVSRGEMGRLLPDD